MTTSTLMRARIRAHKALRAMRRNPDAILLWAAVLAIAAGAWMARGAGAGLIVFGVGVAGEIGFSRVLEHCVTVEWIRAAAKRPQKDEAS